jgi:hypothetical protein
VEDMDQELLPSRDQEWHRAKHRLLYLVLGDS